VDKPDTTDPELLPVLAGDRVTLRPGTHEEAPILHAILSGPSVMRWWGQPEPEEDIAAHLRGEGGTCLLVIEADYAVAGGIQYDEEEDEMYRHAGIDIFLAECHQGHGLGREAIVLLVLLVRFLIDRRHHHRLIIDPAAANARAIRCYASVGFRPVGIMREYERGRDGTFHDGLLMDLVAMDREA